MCLEVLSQARYFVLARIAVIVCLVLSASGFNSRSCAAVGRANADYDLDGDVDAADLLLLYEAQSCGDPSCDLDADGKYTAHDFFLFAASWGAVAPTPTPTLPPYVTPLPTLIVDLPGGVPLAMVRLPTGSFMMGRNPGEQDSDSSEEPRHTVNIGYPFYIGKFELTKAQWQAVMGTKPWQSYVVFDDPNSPAVFVEWYDIRGADGFLDRLNALGQGTFRLPSESEWEYACRAGTTTRFYWGNDSNYSQIGNYAWYVGNALNAGETYAHAVGRKLPNAWGLYDMSGNVWEWCEDDQHPTYWWAGRPDNGAAWIDNPRGPSRAERGGSWRSPASYCRSAFRAWGVPNEHHINLGLRLVREAPPTPTETPTASPTRTGTPTPTASPTPTPTLSPLTVNLPNLPVGAKPLVLVPVPAGSFMMGGYANEQDSNLGEAPQHQVSIGSPFYIGKYEVTKAQWVAVLGTKPWEGQGLVLDHEDSPAVYVSWDDCRHFAAELSKLGQGTFRLPSEAEWEYACRAGTTTRFYWGDDPTHSETGDYAWYSDNCSDELYAHIVGLKLPNPWGLYDMSGNVWEWCEDWYHWDYTNAPQDGSAWVVPAGGLRIMRGGSWYASARECRAAFRGYYGPNERGYLIGLRIVRTP